MKFSRANFESVPVGALATFPNSYPVRFTQDNMTFLRVGYLETDPFYYDPEVFPVDLAFGVVEFAANSDAESTTALEQNSAGTIIAGRRKQHLERSTDDGATWTRTFTATGTTSQVIRDIKYFSALGLWVAVGDNGFCATSSDDGVSWTTRNLGSTNIFRSVDYNGTNIVAVGNSISSRSADGVTWTASSVTGTITKIVALSAGDFVIYAANTIQRSINSGASWVNQTAMSGGASGTGEVSLVYDGTNTFLVKTGMSYVIKSASANNGQGLVGCAGDTCLEYIRPWPTAVSGTTLTGITRRNGMFVIAASNGSCWVGPSLNQLSYLYLGLPLNAVPYSGSSLLYTQSGTLLIGTSSLVAGSNLLRMPGVFKSGAGTSLNFGSKHNYIRIK